MAYFELNPHSLFMSFQSHPSSGKEEDVPPTKTSTGDNGQFFSLFNVGIRDNNACLSLILHNSFDAIYQLFVFKI